MKKTLSFAWALPAMTLFASCKKITGEGPVITELRHPSNFTGIRSSVVQDVSVIIDTVSFIEIKAQQNILDVIETFNSGGDLVVKLKSGHFVGRDQDVRIAIHTGSIKYLEQDGAGHLGVFGTAAGDHLKCSINGSGSIGLEKVSIQNTLIGEINGSGDIIIEGGNVLQANFESNGSGDISSSGLYADNVHTAINGSGSMRIRAVRYLYANISGSGNVYYKGTPMISTSISGSGRVRPF